VLASVWNDERHYSSIRSWHGLGETAAYGLPMTIVVLILGQHRDGRRAGPWTKGLLHPQNHKLRFRKKKAISSEIFSDKWEQIWREDRGEIETEQWLRAMIEDDILRDVCFTVELEPPEPKERQRILDMTARKLERLAKMTKPPEPSMGMCDRPPCPYRDCWAIEPSEKTGFVKK
jgi:hypothetical protein